MGFNRLLRLKRPIFWRNVSSLSALSLLAACSSVPKLEQGVALRSAETVAAQQSLQPQGSAAWPGEGWWLAYGDPQLEALIGEGLRDAPDIAIAAARMRHAAAQAQEAGAKLRPSLDAQASAGFEKQSFNNGFPDQFIALLPQGFEVPKAA